MPPATAALDDGSKAERDPAWWSRRAWSLLSAVRARAPLVQCITNLVSMDITANALLAAGASSAMVHSLREVPDFPPRCDAVYVNVGTLSEDWLPSMRAAASAGRPWVLDPVAAAASVFRMEACLELLALRSAVVRGNGLRNPRAHRPLGSRLVKLQGTFATYTILVFFLQFSIQLNQG